MHELFLNQFPKTHRMEEWLKDQYYKDLRDDSVKIKGSLAELKSKAMEEINKLAAKGEELDMELVSGADKFRVQSKLEPAILINGRKLA